MRATKAKHQGALSLPPVKVTIAAGDTEVFIRISDQGSLRSWVDLVLSNSPGGGLWTPENQIKTPADLLSFSHTRNASRLALPRIGALRTVSSSPRGVRATVDEQVSYQHDPEVDAGVGPHPRIGLGLPMSNIFAKSVRSTHTRFNN